MTDEIFSYSDFHNIGFFINPNIQDAQFKAMKRREQLLQGAYFYANSDRDDECRNKSAEIFGRGTIPLTDKENSAFFLGDAVLKESGYLGSPFEYWLVNNKDLPQEIKTEADARIYIGNQIINTARQQYDQRKEYEKKVDEVRDSMPMHLANAVRKGFLGSDNNAKKSMEVLSEIGMWDKLDPSIQRARAAWKSVKWDIGYNGMEKFDRERIRDVADLLSNEDGELDEMAVLAFSCALSEQAKEWQTDEEGVMSAIRWGGINAAKKLDNALLDAADRDEKERGREIAIAEAAVEAQKFGMSKDWAEIHMREAAERWEQLHSPKVERIRSIINNASRSTLDASEKAGDLVKVATHVGTFAGEAGIPMAAAVTASAVAGAAGLRMAGQALAGWAAGFAVSHDSIISRSVEQAYLEGVENPEEYGYYSGLGQAAAENIAGVGTSGFFLFKGINSGLARMSAKAGTSRLLSNAYARATLAWAGTTVTEGTMELAEEELGSWMGAQLNALARANGVQMSEQKHEWGKTIAQMPAHQIAAMYVFAGVLGLGGGVANYTKAQQISMDVDKLKASGFSDKTAREVVADGIVHAQKVEEVKNSDLSEEKKDVELKKLSDERLAYLGKMFNKDVVMASNADMQKRSQEENAEFTYRAMLAMAIRNGLDEKAMEDLGLMGKRTANGNYLVSYEEPAEGENAKPKLVQKEWTRDQLTGFLLFQRGTSIHNYIRETQSALSALQFAQSVASVDELGFHLANLKDMPLSEIEALRYHNAITPELFTAFAEHEAAKIAADMSAGMSRAQAEAQPSTAFPGVSRAQVIGLERKNKERIEHAIQTGEIKPGQSVFFPAINISRLDGSTLVAYFSGKVSLPKMLEEMFEGQLKQQARNNPDLYNQLGKALQNIQGKLGVKLLPKNKTEFSKDDIIEGYSHLAVAEVLANAEYINLPTAEKAVVMDVLRNVETAAHYKLIADAWQTYKNSDEGKEYLGKGGKDIMDIMRDAGFTFGKHFSASQVSAEERAKLLEERDFMFDVEEEAKQLEEQANAEEELSDVNAKEAKEPIVIPASESVTGEEIVEQPEPNYTIEPTAEEQSPVNLAYQNIVNGTAKVNDYALYLYYNPMSDAEATERGIRTLNQQGEESALYTQGKLLSVFKDGKYSHADGQARDVLTGEVPVNRITHSPEVPQFKTNKAGHKADEKGVVYSLPGDYRMHDPIHLWHRKDGSLVVISGRHRLQKAIEAGAEFIPATVFPEVTGRDAEWARMHDFDFGANFSIQEAEIPVYTAINDNVGLQQHLNDIVEPIEINFTPAKKKGGDWVKEALDYYMQELAGQSLSIGNTGYTLHVKATKNRAKLATYNSNTQARSEAFKQIKEIIAKAYRLGSEHAESREKESKFRSNQIANTATFERFGYPVSIGGEVRMFWFTGQTKSENDTDVLFAESGLTEAQKGDTALTWSSQDATMPPSAITLGDALSNVKGKIKGVPQIIKNAPTANLSIAALSPGDRFQGNPLAERMSNFMRTEARRYERTLSKQTPGDAAANALFATQSIIHAVDKYVRNGTFKLPRESMVRLKQARALIDKYAQMMKSGKVRSFNKIDKAEQAELLAAMAEASAGIDMVAIDAMTPEEFEALRSEVAAELMPELYRKHAEAMASNIAKSKYKTPAETVARLNALQKAAETGTRNNGITKEDLLESGVLSQPRGISKKALLKKYAQQKYEELKKADEQAALDFEKAKASPLQALQRIIKEGRIAANSTLGKVEQRQLTELVENEAQDAIEKEVRRRELKQTADKIQQAARERNERMVRVAATGRIGELLRDMLNETADIVDLYLKDELLKKLKRVTNTVKLKRSKSGKLKGKMGAADYRRMDTVVQLMGMSTRAKDDALGQIEEARLLLNAHKNEIPELSTNKLIEEIRGELTAQGKEVTLENVYMALNNREADLLTFADLDSMDYAQARKAANALATLIYAGRAEWELIQQEKYEKIKAFLDHFYKHTSALAGTAQENDKAKRGSIGNIFNSSMSDAQLLFALGGHEALRPVMDELRRNLATAQDARNLHLKSITNQIYATYARLIGMRPQTEAGYTVKQLREASNKLSMELEKWNQTAEPGIVRKWMKDGNLMEQKMELTRLQALDLILTYRQPHYAENAAAHGYTEEVLNKLEEFCGTRLMAMGEAFKYSIQNDGTAAVYEEREGIPMYNDPTYWPGSININTINITSEEPIVNPFNVAGSYHFLKERVKHTHEAKYQNAFEKWKYAISERANYIYLAPITSTLNRMLAHNEFANRLKSLIGEDLFKQLKLMLNTVDGSTWQETSLRDEANNWAARMLRATAPAVLALNPQTYIRQLSAVSNYAMMPNVDWLKLPAMITLIRQDKAKMTLGQILQLDSFKARARDNAALNDMIGLGPNAKFSRFNQLAKAGMNHIDVIDVWSNAVSACLYYNMLYEQLEAKNKDMADPLSEEEIRKYCEQSVSEMLRLVAQPLEKANKSAMYWKTGNTWYGSLFLYMSSEMINKAGMLRATYLKNKAEGMSWAKNMSWLVGRMGLGLGGMTFLVEAAIFMLFTGDLPDDEKEWLTAGIALAIYSSFGQYFSRIPFVGSVTDYYLSPYGKYTTNKNVAQAPALNIDKTSAKLLKMLSDNKEYSGAEWQAAFTRFVRDLTAVAGLASGIKPEVQWLSTTSAVLQSLSAAMNLTYPVSRAVQSDSWWRDVTPDGYSPKKTKKREKSSLEEGLDALFGVEKDKKKGKKKDRTSKKD